VQRRAVKNAAVAEPGQVGGDKKLSGSNRKRPQLGSRRDFFPSAKIDGLHDEMRLLRKINGGFIASCIEVKRNINRRFSRKFALSIVIKGCVAVLNATFGVEMQLPIKLRD
jgi:hypothetical protein